MSRLTRSQANLFFQLVHQHPWLATGNEPSALQDLMELCENLDEQELVVELLHRFTYIDSSLVVQHTTAMANVIVKKWKLSKINTQLAGTSFTNEADSSQMLLHHLRPCLAALDWQTIKTVPLLGKVVRNVDRFPDVVIVDEFAGTGETIVNRVNWLRSELNQIDKEDYTIRVCLLACMEQARTKFDLEGIEYHAELTLRKGISGHEEPSQVEDAIERMLRIERRLKNEVNGTSLPSLGYGRSEALYGMEAGNVPNNVFPIFWWPWLHSGQRHLTLFSRAEASQ